MFRLLFVLGVGVCQAGHSGVHSPPGGAPAPTLGVIVDSSQPSGLRAVPLPSDQPLLAWAGFHDTIMKDGWSYLAVHSNASQPDSLQAQAAGFVEGALTHQRIFEYASNHLDQYSWSANLTAFLRSNDQWMRMQMGPGTGPWWHQASLMLDQQSGLVSGYAAHAPAGHGLSAEVMVTLSMHSDFDTLCPLFGGCGPVRQRQQHHAKANYGAPPPTAPNRVPDHCSVLVKLVGGKEEKEERKEDETKHTPQLPWSELFVAHTTWSGFEDMTRVYKMYDLPFSTDGKPGSAPVPGRRLAFSSYPGNLFSTDDWYTTSSGLAVTETTIDNHNTTLWSHVVPETVLTWLRTQVANRLAVDGPSWAAAFEQQNSGTYNNEFHVVDYNVFSASRRAGVLLPHLLTVVDQMPGFVESADVTEKLESSGYWASYNRPGLAAAYSRMNYSAVVQQYGPHYSHEKSSRAVLFKMLHGSVVDEATLKKVMRMNRFNDSAHFPKSVTNQMCSSGPSASNAISERGDLTPLSSHCADDVTQQNEGGLDCKYTTAAMMEDRQSLRTVAQSGPTYDDQPVFEWSTSPFKDVPHVGQPDRWDFPWVVVDWE